MRLSRALSRISSQPIMMTSSNHIVMEGQPEYYALVVADAVADLVMARQDVWDLETRSENQRKHIRALNREIKELKAAMGDLEDLVTLSEQAAIAEQQRSLGMHDLNSRLARELHETRLLAAAMMKHAEVTHGKTFVVCDSNSAQLNKVQ